MDHDNFEFDSVKAEKANALAKYRRVRNIAKLFQVIEVFVALTLISWTSTRLSSAVSVMSGKYLIEYSAYLLNPHVVFIIGNVIVVALYLHSRHFDDAAESDSGSGAGTVSEDYSQCGAIDHDAAAGSAENELKSMEPVTEGTTEGEDKQIVCYENAVAKTECEAAATAIEEATKQIRRFQRTQSEKLKRQMSMKPKKEYRRSETDVRRLVVTCPRGGRTGALTAYDKEEFRGAIKSFDTVDRLSNEEFRLRVEAFIEKQQSFLKAQKLSEGFH